MTNDRDAVRLLIEARAKARKAGMIYLGVILVAGVVGWVMWAWYVFAAALALAILFNFAYSLQQAKRIAARTGLSFEEQAELLNAHEGGVKK